MYLCHRFSKESTDSAFCYGSLDQVLDGTAKGYSQEVEDQVAKHRARDVKLWREECRNCIAQAGCMKNCMHTSWMTNKSLDTPPKLWCEISREAARIVSWLDRELRRVDPDWWMKDKKIDYCSCGHCRACPMDNNSTNRSCTTNRGNTSGRSNTQNRSNSGNRNLQKNPNCTNIGCPSDKNCPQNIT
jgi:radical SAM protein with 4Fe4S-binding SPASM domain